MSKHTINKNTDNNTFEGPITGVDNLILIGELVGKSLRLRVPIKENRAVQVMLVVIASLILIY